MRCDGTQRTQLGRLLYSKREGTTVQRYSPRMVELLDDDAAVGIVHGPPRAEGLGLIVPSPLVPAPAIHRGPSRDGPVALLDARIAAGHPEEGVEEA